MVGGVEGVGGEDDVVGVCVGGAGWERGPVEGAGGDGGARGCEGPVCGDVGEEVWEDGGEVCEVGCCAEEGCGGEAGEAGAGAEFDDVGRWVGGVIGGCGRGWGWGWGWIEGVWGGADGGEDAGEEEGQAFGEEVGCQPGFVAEVVVCEGGFVEGDVDGAARVRAVAVGWDAEDAGLGRDGGAAGSLGEPLAGCFPDGLFVGVGEDPGQGAGYDARQVGWHAVFVDGGWLGVRGSCGAGGRGEGEQGDGGEEGLGGGLVVELREVEDCSKGTWFSCQSISIVFWYAGRDLLTVHLAAYIFIIYRMSRIRNNT